MHRTGEQANNRLANSGYTSQATAETPLTPFEVELLAAINSLPPAPRMPTPRPETDADFARLADVIGVLREWNTPATVLGAFLKAHETTLAEVRAKAPRYRVEAEGCVCWVRRDATPAEALAEVERQLQLLGPPGEPTSPGRVH